MATKGISLMKRLWHEKPDLACGFGLVIIGILGACHYYTVYDKNTSHQHRYEYTVIRAEDADPEGQAKGVYN